MARYRDIMADIKCRIRERGLAPGDWLGSERQFMQTYEVSGKTIKHALRELEHEGVVYRRNGVGTFVGETVLATGQLAFFAPGLGATGFVREVFEQTEAACGERGLQLLYSATGCDRDRTMAGIAALSAANLRGVVFAPFAGEGERHNGELVGALRKKTNRVILLDNKIPSLSGVSFVGCENIGSSFKLSEILLRRKYGAYVFISTAPGPVVAERLEGFRSAMKSYGVPPDCVKVWDEGTSPDLARRIADTAGALGSVGVFCVNDGLAHGLLYQLNELQVRIPDNVGLVGFGGIRLPYLYPLTTAQMNFEQMGREIVRLVFAEDDETVVVPTTIVIGRTT